MGVLKQHVLWIERFDTQGSPRTRTRGVGVATRRPR
ncbi:MAG: hypothetical protein QOJ89_1847 [bacterium]